jgi:hypothetical protein
MAANSLRALSCGTTTSFTHCLTLAPYRTVRARLSEFCHIGAMRRVAWVAMLLSACAHEVIPEAPAGNSASYPLVVSFGSECCGTDTEADDELESIVNHYGVHALGAVHAYWGKEGEYDVCFTLTGLSPAERMRFVSEIKTRIRRRLVEVIEHSPCPSLR